jgi:asparagine synthase (glutamine-hydrolysing)
VPGPDTVWQNIWKLPPGHMLEWSAGREPRVSRYWKTDVISANEPVDIAEKTKQFETLFLDSVAQRLLASDVPVGVMLSGGLDSSAIAAAAVELGHKQFHTFCVGFAEGGEYSELHFARKVAKHLGLQHHEIVIDQQGFLEILPQAVHTADEPLADLTIVPLLALLRVASRHVKVALSGEGSDEILAGYNLQYIHRKFQIIRHIQSLPPSSVRALGQGLKFISKRLARKLDDMASIPLSQWNITLRNCKTSSWSETEKGCLWPAFDARDSVLVLRSMYAEAMSDDPLEQILSVWQKSWLVEDLLMKADKMSMAASMELRVPFLDYRLVEWANRQPVEVKIGTVAGRYSTKRVLRRFAKNRLPREIIDRPKKGFPVPVFHWLMDERFGKWAAEHLCGGHARISDLFDVQEMKRQLLRAGKGEFEAAKRVWLLIVLETWLREFDVDVSADVPSSDAMVMVT